MNNYKYTCNKDLTFMPLAKSLYISLQCKVPQSTSGTDSISSQEKEFMAKDSVKLIPGPMSGPLHGTMY